MTRVLVLGGGPAGLGAALWLARRGFEATLVEAQDRPGGNAGSFPLDGLPVDYGSHRLHPATDPAILAELRGLLGADLLQRPRHGRIRLGGRWIHFPLRPLDLALHAPPSFVAGVTLDSAAKLVGGRSAPSGPGERSARPAGESFADVLLRGLGATVCREFYFPYARKIWGLEPEEISPIQARRRVSAGSIGKLVRRLLPGGTAGGGRSTKGIFYYPRGGFGQISEALAGAARSAGAELLLETCVRRAVAGAPFAVVVEDADGTRRLEAEHVWSTIPVGALVRALDPPAPSDVLTAAGRLEQRAMLLVYLVLEQDRFTEYDAHYFPSADVPFTRVSEPKNYSGRSDPEGRTVLCAEIPCATADPVWSAGPEELSSLVRGGLERAGLPVRSPVLDVAVRRLPSAYPLYRIGWERDFEAIDTWLEGVPGLLTFGRQGLYAHDNTHHALFMARAAVLCMDERGRFDRAAWARWREVFTTHVVED